MKLDLHSLKSFSQMMTKYESFLSVLSNLIEDTEFYAEKGMTPSAAANEAMHKWRYLIEACLAEIAKDKEDA